MADIERWITINGAHIPIIKGESRAKAVANFIKGKKDKIKSKRAGLYGKWNSLERVLHKADQEEDWETYDEYSKDYDKAAKDVKDFEKRHPQRTIKGVRTKETRKDKMHDKLIREYEERHKERSAKAEEYDRKADEAYDKGKDDKRWNYMGKRDDLYKKDYNDEQRTYEKIAREAKKIDKEKPKTYKQKLDPIFKKKQYSDKKSITTPAGYFSPKELHERENRIKNEYIKFWHGKSNPETFERNKARLIKTGQATEREYGIMQYDASRLDDRLKARNRKVALKGATTKFNKTKKK